MMANMYAVIKSQKDDLKLWNIWGGDINQKLISITCKWNGIGLIKFMSIHSHRFGNVSPNV